MLAVGLSIWDAVNDTPLLAGTSAEATRFVAARTYDSEDAPDALAGFNRDFVGERAARAAA